MNATNGTAAKGLHEWWASPPRPGLHRLINPWEYRHLRVSGVTRIAGGSINVFAGVVCLSYRAYGWAAFFLVLGRSISRGLLVSHSRSLRDCRNLSLDSRPPVRRSSPLLRR